jgi:hypothetical protein
MQERGMVSLQLSPEHIDDWAVVGSAADCIATLRRAQEDVGLNHVSLSCYNLPPESAARVEYVQRVGEDVVRHV